MDLKTKDVKKDIFRGNENFHDYLKKMLGDLYYNERVRERVGILVASFLEDSLDAFSKREVRRALAITITIFYFTIVSLALFGDFENKNINIDAILSNTSLVFLVVIAFYFGSRAVEDGIKLYKALRGGKR